MKQMPLSLEDVPQRPRTAALRAFHVSQPGGHVSVPEALEGDRKAIRQEDAILAWLRREYQLNYSAVGLIWPLRYTPSSVAAAFPQWPLTSIRRALTNLTTRGLLTHHKADRRPGPLGSKESTWSLA